MSTNKPHKPYTGSKFYRYIDGCEQPEIIRVSNIDYDKKIIKYFDADGNKCKCSYDSLIKDYKMLAPDGAISFSIVSVNNSKDVIVALKAFPKTKEDLAKDNNLPYAICRQMVMDVFSSNVDTENLILGVSMSQDTCPANVDFNRMFACTGLDYTRMVNVYLDDTLDSILNLFDNHMFDKVLEELYSNNPETCGMCTSLVNLLTENNFMYDFRKCFNIMELPFAVDIETEGLSTENIDFLSKELKIDILETYVVEYSRTIDTSKFKRDFILASSAQESFSKVYIVGYDKV